MPKRQFIELAVVDNECRCCGKLPFNTCPRCQGLLDNGYAFFIEVKDSSTQTKKKPTGYKIAILAVGMYEGGHPEIAITPTIYFIKTSDLKQFLGDEYKQNSQSMGHGRLLTEAPGHRFDRGTAKGSRYAVDLHHD